ncbi:MAG TPA: hypothetical protein VN317_05785 [Candidatus Methanoperedens sp.]|nr:hypothetical protein [Candidatus Methanoperedens sp.]
MLEIALAAAIALILLASAAGDGVVHLLFLSGAAAILLGLVAGIPAGIVYHALLFRALAAHGSVTPRWWWHPTRLHASLPAAARRPFLPWFRAGAAGFLLAIVGCILVLAALLAQ